MSGFFCGVGTPTGSSLPDAGNGICCDGAAMFGPDRCTCWLPVYDLEQQPPRPEETPDVQPRMCGDCAYRPASPERQGNPAAAADAGELQRLVDDGDPFWCHQGIRRPLTFRHPSGVETDGSALAYKPPIIDGVPYQADGSPALLCGGWMALRLKAFFR